MPQRSTRTFNLRDFGRAGSDPIALIVSNGERFRTVEIDYHDGLRYPHLERVEGAPARLDDILAPLP